MVSDLFEGNEETNLVSLLLLAKRPLDIRDFVVKEFILPENYQILTACFSNDPSLSREEIGTVLKRLLIQEMGLSDIPPIYTALYEAVLNAHEHGNGGHPNTSVRVAYPPNSKGKSFVVSDEGGILMPEFIPFILAQKKRKENDPFLNFYEFSGVQKPTSLNMGTGTSFMHAYSNVAYRRDSKTGGLTVKLTEKQAR